MTKPVFTPILCGVCGKVMGKKAGVQVVTGVVCDDLLCQYQPESTVNEARDALIVAGALDGLKVSQVAFSTGMSRQRVYQIFDAWKAGV